MKVVFPALFYKESDDGYSVFIPDLDNISTCGDNLKDAIFMAQELIASTVFDLIEDNKKIPNSSDIESLDFSKLENYLQIKDWNYVEKFKSYVFVDVNKFSKKWETKLIKKTLNIPKWLNTIALENNINFSETLKEALLTKLNIE